MKKMIKTCLAVLFIVLMSINVMADVQQENQKPDYTTDYYMIVESKAGGIDIYSLPDFNSEKLNDRQIPNGTALHIEGETEDTANNRIWGYTEYHGMYGYVPLDDCRPAQSRKEAIDSELYIAGRDQVDYNADYNVKAWSEDGSQKLYQGPGTKYGEVPGVRDIQNGENLHITEDAELVDGSHWGKTSIDDKEGWMDLEKTEEWAKEHGIYENSQVSETVEMTPMPAAEETPDPVGVSVTPAVTQNPKVSATPTVTEAVLSATPAGTLTVTETPVPTETTDTTETPEPTETPEQTETSSPAADKQNNKDDIQTSGRTVKAQKSSRSQNPLIWIAGIAVLAAVGVVIYHFIKRN